MSKVYYKFMVSGFFFLLGLEENPLLKLKKRYSRKSVSNAIASDWKNVGIDMRKAFDEQARKAN